METAPLLAIGFLHPAIAAVAVATGVIPVLIHLMNRRRFVRVPWAAMSFLLAARRRSAKRVWLEQLLLLLVRVAILVLLGVAIARPYVPASARLGLRASRVHRIILLDNSLSMQAISQPMQTGVAPSEVGSRFTHAKGFVERLLASLPPTDAVSLITLASPASAVIDEPATDHRFVRERVASITATQRSTDVSGAIERAIQLLASSPYPQANRVVYFVSDFTQRDWFDAEGQRRGVAARRSAPPDDDRSRGAPRLVQALDRLAQALNESATDLHLVGVDPQARENLSLARLGVSSDDGAGTGSGLVAVDHPVRIVADVVNHGDATVRDATVQISRKTDPASGGQIIRSQPLGAIEPGASVTVAVTVVFSRSGTHLIEAKINRSALASVSRAGPGVPRGDTLGVDDERYLSVEVREQIAVLLVDGRPGTTQLTGSAGFLATALSPLSAEGMPSTSAAARRASAWRSTALIEPKIITEPELETEALGNYQAVAVCNVRRLSESTWQRLEAFVEGGGGLQIFCGDAVSAEPYNRFGFKEGKGLLPARLGPIHDTTDRSAPMDNGGGSQDGHGRSDIGFELTDPPHPLTAEFAGLTESGLFLAGVHRYMSLDGVSPSAETVLRYTDGQPALIASTFGKGRVLLWTTTANMDWTNLPAKGDYVSMMLAAATHLVPLAGRHRNVVVADTIMEPLTAAETSMPKRVTAFGGVTPVPGRGNRPAQPILVPVGDGLALAYGPVERSGALSLTIGSRSRLFAANVDPAESDLRRLDEQALADLIDRPVHVVTVQAQQTSAFGRQPAAPRSTELASVAVYLVIGLLLMEMVMAMWFGAQRARQSEGVMARRES